MKKRILIFLSCFFVFSFLLIPVDRIYGNTTQQEETIVETLAGFEYELDQDAAVVTLKKYTDSNATITIADRYLVEGEEYRTQIDSQTLFYQNNMIKNVMISGEIEFVDDSMSKLFYECKQLLSVDLSELETESVTDMSYMFYKCENIQTIDLSGLDTSSVKTMKSMFSTCKKLKNLIGYENLDTSSVESIYQTFNSVQNGLKTNEKWTIDLSEWDLDQVTNSGWCFQSCAAEKIILPDNLAVMSAGFFNHTSKITGSSYTIPKGVKKIGYGHTIYDFATKDFVEFEVAEGNEWYKAVDGILYSADGKELIAVPRNKPFDDDQFVIPEGVEFIPELSFSRNNNFQTLVLPNTMKFRQYVPSNDPQYIIFEDSGNLNEGNTLSIALYIYTSVKEYATKEGNKNYTGVDGILYNYDMTEVVAVPTRYEKYMNIPEGVTDWNTFAMWAVGKEAEKYLILSTGVKIPSTMTYIASDQLEVLNHLNQYTKAGESATIHVNNTLGITKKYPFQFVISVAENNPVFSVNEEGYLIADGIAERGVVLEKDTYIYDGTTHEPDVTVTCNDKTLIEGADYVVDYSDHVEAGTASVTVRAIGDYRGEVVKYFTILESESEPEPEPEPDPEPEPTPDPEPEPTPEPTPEPIPEQKPATEKSHGTGKSTNTEKAKQPQNPWISVKLKDGTIGWKYNKPNGTLATGVMKQTEDGRLCEQVAWELIGKVWYAFGADAIAKSGWIFDENLNGWFYVDINKGMQIGWHYINGKWYYLQPETNGKQGIMLSNCWIDGWYVDENGAWDEKPQVK